jgi:hypothetical protein
VNERGRGGAGNWAFAEAFHATDGPRHLRITNVPDVVPKVRYPASAPAKSAGKGRSKMDCSATLAELKCALGALVGGGGRGLGRFPMML